MPALLPVVQGFSILATFPPKRQEKNPNLTKNGNKNKYIYSGL